MNAPLGYTRAALPLMVSVARPLPMDPKMKFESFEVMTCPGEGYCTRTASGPSTSGMAGSGGGGAGVPGMGDGMGAGAGAGEGVAPPPQATAAARDNANAAVKTRGNGIFRR